MRKIGLAVVIFSILCETAYGQQAPAEPSGEGYFIWRNAEFVHDDWRRLRDGRADLAMEAARENVLAFQRLRAARDAAETGAQAIPTTRGGSSTFATRGRSESFARIPSRQDARR